MTKGLHYLVCLEILHFHLPLTWLNSLVPRCARGIDLKLQTGMTQVLSLFSLRGLEVGQLLALLVAWLSVSSALWSRFSQCLNTWIPRKISGEDDHNIVRVILLITIRR